MREQLKVNVLSLAAESRFIRKEVAKIKGTSELKGADPRAQKMIWHRTWDLRNEARAAQLLYGYVRHVPYRRIEPKADYFAYRWHDTLKRLRSKCKKFEIEFADLERWLAKEPAVVG